MRWSRPLLGSKLRVGIGPDCLPNLELSLLCGRITLGHFLVGHEFELVQGTQYFAFLRSTVSVSSLALFLHSDVLSLSFLFPSDVLSPSFLFPSGVGRLQTQV